MSKLKAVNKTEFFQALEQELLSSGNSGSGVHPQLEEVTKDLAQYFENPSMLAMALNVGSLTFEHAFLKRKGEDTFIASVVNTLLSEFRDARDSDPEHFFAFVASQVPSNGRAINNAADVAVLQGDKENLNSSLLVKSWFRDIGDLLEGSLQPFLRYRLKVLDILERRPTSARRVEDMTFGDVVSELMSESKIGEYYRVPLHAIPISQWRNIANHNSYNISGEQVICTYGPADKLKTISLLIDELASSLVYCHDLYYAHKVAIELFNIDNMMELREHHPKVSVSDFTRNTSLAYGLVSAGFSVVHAEYFPGKWVLDLKDKHTRKMLEIKRALQEACYSYMLFENPIEFSVIVFSKQKRHQIGFVASIAEKDGVLPAGFKGDVRRVDNSHRLGPPTSE